jgi:hypothetical protein
MKYPDGKTKQIQRKKYQSQDKQFFLINKYYIELYS